jgi:hypothetical protein
MWRYIFLNLCFVVLVIAFLALQHSFPVFGPTSHSKAVTADDPSQTFELASDAESSGTLRARADVSRAVAYLYDMWHRGMVLKEWTIEYNAFRWEILRASSPAESDLLDARFHIANAEVFTEAMSKKTRAIRELGRAETSLKAAETLVEPSLVRQVKTIDDEITAAETREQTEDTFSMMPFETIKAHLDHLIAMVHSARISREPSRAIPVQG